MVNIRQIEADPVPEWARQYIACKQDRHGKFNTMKQCEIDAHPLTDDRQFRCVSRGRWNDPDNQVRELSIILGLAADRIDEKR